MSKEDLNQIEEAELDNLFEDDESPKPQDGDDSQDASKQEVSEDTFLARVNKETGKNFKSLDDWKDSLKNLEKAVADKGRKKEPKEAPKTNSVIKRLFFKETPEAETVWDDVEKEAKELGVDPFDHYESKKGWQLEAKARFEEQKEQAEAKGKIKSPSNNIGDGEIDFAKITPDQISKLSKKDYDKYKEYLKKSSYREGKAILLD
jgi:hypothetical protein